MSFKELNFPYVDGKRIHDGVSNGEGRILSVTYGEGKRIIDLTENVKKFGLQS